MPPSLARLIAFAAAILPLASTQFTYPPNVPSNKILSDYTSGRETPITNYIIHDAIIGSYNTPKPTFSITRCAQNGRTNAILPSNGVFNSTEGRVAEDGTWQVMDSYSNGMFENVYNAGKNLWIIPDFAGYVGNETTGHICWWELYSVVEEQTYDLTGELNGIVRQVTLLGNDTENYFASTPFVVQTAMRVGNRNYTWSSSGGHDNRASSTTIVAGNRPTGNAAVGAIYRNIEESGTIYAIVSLFGVWLGL
ncbi:hypothetical protein G7Y89_g5691 [Cudoniella acicularis]|uniref:Uncharacterized protein n=1 Tax=Cudoniella acicularis TaxID=354080 RepID=A0A8H4W3R0_9HELO|nr:hypothetical protein G7Y89_g5691 [Cudoniella acicularis]